MKHIIPYMFLIIFIIPLLFSENALARKSSHEKWLQDKWCRDHGGTTNAKLNDFSKCDCLTWKNSIKIQFNPKKWMDSVGTALNYSMRTGIKGGIVLVIKKKKDKSYWIRLKTTVKYFQLPIDVWLWERYKD
jgi:hypothetical protein